MTKITRALSLDANTYEMAKLKADQEKKRISHVINEFLELYIGEKVQDRKNLDKLRQEAYTLEMKAKKAKMDYESLLEKQRQQDQLEKERAKNIITWETDETGKIIRDVV